MRPTPADVGGPPRTAVIGGAGLVAGSVYPLILSASVAVPLPREAILFGDPLLQLASSLVLALAWGILAFGLPPETGIVGGSRLGQGAVFVFGLTPLVLGIGRLLSPGLDEADGAAEGVALSAATIVGLTSGGIAAALVAHAGLLRGYARWALVPVVTGALAGFVLALVPLGPAFWLLTLAGAAEPALLAAAGTAYALSARGRAAGRVSSRAP